MKFLAFLAILMVANVVLFGPTMLGSETAPALEYVMANQPLASLNAPMHALVGLDALVLVLGAVYFMYQAAQARSDRRAASIIHALKEWRQSP